MAQKIDIPVVINGKVYTLSGFEGEDYLQNVANYVNRKIAEFDSVPNYSRLSSEFKKALLAINIADDYFKALDEIERLKGEIEEKNNELYDMKHELVTAQIQVRQASKKQ